MAEIQRALMGAVDRAVDDARETHTYTHETDTYPAGYEYEAVNDGKAASNTMENIGDLARQQADSLGLPIDRPEEHDLSHMSPGNTADDDVQNLAEHGITVDVDQGKEAAQRVLDQVQGNLPKPEEGEAENDDE